MDLANINIYVVRIAHTPRSLFRNTIQEMENREIQNLYLLINGMAPGKAGYGYQSSYYKTEEKTKKKRPRRKDSKKK